MAAATAINKDDVLVSAPWTAVISAEMSLPVEVSQALAAFDQAPISATEKLTLFLMCFPQYHRFRADSEFRPYLCMLPRNYSSPLFWDDRSLFAHGPRSDLATRTNAAKLSLVQQYNRLLPLLFSRARTLFDPAVHTLPAFLWAAQTVKSRNWFVNRQRPPFVQYAMLPLGDMINHRPHEKGGGRTSKDGARFELRAGSDYAAGDEVFISYGNHCNLHLLLTYGFEVEGNGVNCTRRGGPATEAAGEKPP